MISRSAIAALVSILAVFPVTSSVAQDLKRPLRLLVPSPPGGPSDFAARLIAPKLSEALGQNVVVDNRQSVNGILATEIAAKRVSPSAAMVFSGCAVRVTLLPPATPTRLRPKSKARKERGGEDTGAASTALMRAPPPG